MIGATLAAGALLAIFHLNLGARLTGLSLLAPSLWFLKNDLATRTIHHPNPLTRYIGFCLFAGFLWLGIGVLISITQKGYIKRVAAKSIRAQARGGRGVTGHAPKDEDEVLVLIPARTLNTLLFFSGRGKVYSEKAYQIPDADRTARGIPVVNILALDPGEAITAVVPVPDFDVAEYCMMATREGRIKRLVLSEFSSVRPSGLIAITLDKDDELGWVRLTHGVNEIILVTEKGQALRFSEDEVRPMGRAAAGVTGIRRGKGDHVKHHPPDAQRLRPFGRRPGGPP